MKGLRRTQPVWRRSRRAFTLIELLVASVISSLVISAVLAMQLISVRTIKNLYGPTRARSSRMQALNQIRFRLADGQIGSCVVSDGNHRIRFHDPNLGAGVTSEFQFNPDQKTLYYDNDISSSPGARAVVKGPIDITFTLGSRWLDPPSYTVYLGTDSVVTLFVQTSSELAYSRVDLKEGETVVYLRNYP